MSDSLPEVRYSYISNHDELLNACQMLGQATVLAIDTEFHREHTYHPRFALMQVAGAGHCFLIDPLTIADLSPLWQLLLKPDVLKVFHAARQDLEIILNECGQIPAPLFDTQIAAAFLGYGDQIGLAALVAAVVKKQLPKQESFSDWMARPLTPRQMAYAADDVLFLAEVYTHLHNKLTKAGRLEWVDEEQQEYYDPATYRTEPTASWLRVKGYCKIHKPAHLAVLRSLAAWREETSRERNIPRRKLLPDELLLVLATRSKLNETDLATMRGMHSGFPRKYGTPLLAAWQSGRDCPAADYPDIPCLPPPNAAGTSMRLEMLATLMRLRADSEKIAVALLGCKSELSRLAAWNPKNDLPEIKCLHGWRRTLVGEDLLRLLRGELCLRLDETTRLPVIETLHHCTAPAEMPQTKE